MPRESPIQFRPGTRVAAWLEKLPDTNNNVARDIVIMASYGLHPAVRTAVTRAAARQNKSFDVVCSELAAVMASKDARAAMRNYRLCVTQALKTL
jgi:hypothetical protein